MGLLSKLMISCKRSAELVSKSQDLRLNRTEKIQLRVHTKMCAACKTFELQSNLVEEMLIERLKASTNEDLTAFKAETVSKISE